MSSRVLRNLLILVGISAVMACAKSEPPALPVPEVTVSNPVVRDVQRFVEFNGTTRAVESVEIRARVMGVLESIEFAPGSLVKEGQLLFVIEREQYRALRDQAKAALLSSQAELASARSDEERIQNAIQNNAVSKQDLDQAIARRKRAEADEIGAKARLDQAELDYSYTQVRSPIDGQVARNLVDAGNLVGSGSNTLLTTVKKMDPIYIYFEASERLVLQALEEMREMGISRTEKADRMQGSDMQRGEMGTALVMLSNESEFDHFAYIDYIDNTVDPTTGTIQMRAVAPNEELTLFPGLFVRIRVMGQVQEDAVLVDERAIGTDLGGKYVLVIGDENVVEQRYIVPGAKQDDGMVVIEGGLDGSELYIVNGMLRARAGFPVVPVMEDMQASVGASPANTHASGAASPSSTHASNAASPSSEGAGS